jgi:hypothetical protein
MKTVRVPRTLWLVVVALVAAGCTSGAVHATTSTTSTTLPTTSTTLPPIAAADVAATPSGWVSVDYGDAQVSVPASFRVLYPGWNVCEALSLPGALDLGPATALGPATCGYSPPSRNATAVQFLQGDTTYRPDAISTVVVNGLHLYPFKPIYGALNGYYSPAVGVEVSGTGPLARRILDTLTLSPRRVALAAGSAPTVPPGWHTVTFEGLSFDAPSSWPDTPTAVTGDDLGPGCSTSGVTSLMVTEVALSTDQRPFPVPACPMVAPPEARQPVGAVEVDAGNRYGFPIAISFSNHCLHLHGLIACPATAPAYSIVFLKVTVPGRKTPVLVSIGLAGNGMVARTILYSLRAA